MHGNHTAFFLSKLLLQQVSRWWEKMDAWGRISFPQRLACPLVCSKKEPRNRCRLSTREIDIAQFSFRLMLHGQHTNMSKIVESDLMFIILFFFQHFFKFN